jgi:hypothetical protein
MDDAGRAIFQSSGMIGMGVRQHEGVRVKLVDFAAPVQAAIDHDAFLAVNNDQTAVPPMTRRSGVNLSARPCE